MSAKLEKFMENFGQLGRYQISLVVGMFVLIQTMISVSFSFSYMIQTTNLQYHCRIPDEILQWSPENQSIPYLQEPGGNLQLDKCNMYIDPGNKSLGTVHCYRGYKYLNLRNDQQTITTEWNLVCDKLYWGSFFQSVHFAGVIAGGALCGFFSDRFGRKKPFILSLVCQAATMVAIYFTANLQLSMILAFLRSSFCQASMAIGGTLVMETVSQKIRPLVGVAFGCCGSTALAWATVFAQVIPNWRNSSLILISPTFLLIIISWAMMESPRWLLTKGLTKDAFVITKRIARMNKLKLPPNALQELEDIAEDIRNDKPNTGFGAILQLLANKTMLKYSSIMVVSAFAAQVVSFGLVFSLRAFGGDIYITSYIMSCIDLVFRPFGYYPITRWGRRVTLIGALFIISVSCLLAATLGHFGGSIKALYYVAIAMVIVARIGIGLYWASYHLLANELFPTSARTSIIGCLGSMSRTGTMVIPFIMLLGNHWKHMPYIVYSAITIVAAILALWLPETKGKAMPNTVASAAKVTDTKDPNITTPLQKNLQQQDAITTSNSSAEFNCNPSTL